MINFSLSPLWISLKTSLTATLITFILGVGAARWALTYRGKFQGLMEGIFISPLVLPPTVLGYLLLVLFSQNGPLGLGRILESVFGTSLVFTWTATVISSSIVAFPIMFMAAKGAFKQVDPKLWEAARTLGASEKKIFWEILLPLSWPSLLAGTVLTMARALGEFGATVMLAGNLPGRTQTLPVAIYFDLEAGDYHQAGIWVLISLLFTFGLLFVLNYFSGKVLTFKNPGPKPLEMNMNMNMNLEMKNPSGEAIWGKFQKSLSFFQLAASLPELQEGQIVGILGPSGAGKTMLLRCLAGLETPTSGLIKLGEKVLFDSEKGINLRPQERSIGFVFQNYALFPHLPVKKNVAFGMKKREADFESKLERILHFFQLKELENHYPGELSGGQQQRVALARALAMEPRALLLDEPFSALDTQLRKEMENKFQEYLSHFSGSTLFVTHNLEEVFRICEQVLVMVDGKIIEKGGKKEIFERPRTLAGAQLLGCKNFTLIEKMSPEIPKLKAVDWDCDVVVGVQTQKVTGIYKEKGQMDYLGIHDHHFKLFPTKEKAAEHGGPNAFPCYLAKSAQNLHKGRLFLKLHSPPQHEEDFHLQLEIFTEEWDHLKVQPLPWYVSLPPDRFFTLNP